MKSVDRIVVDVESATDPAVAGWNNLHQAGIGVACVYSYQSDSYTFYDHTEEGRQSLIARIMQAEQVFGFMIGAFDLPVIFRTQRTQLWTGPIGEQLRFRTFDLWRLIAAGMKRNPDSVPPKGYSLDPIAKATLGFQAGAGKTMSAAKAPELFQRGDAASIMKLCGYVLEDVRLERDLVDFALRHGYLIAGGGEIAKIGVDPWHRPKISPGEYRATRPASAYPSFRVAEALGLPGVAVGDPGDAVQVVEGSGRVDAEGTVRVDLSVPAEALEGMPDFSGSRVAEKQYADELGKLLPNDRDRLIQSDWTSPPVNIDHDLMLRVGAEIDKLPPPEFDPGAVAYANAMQSARDAGRDPDLVDPAICMNHGATFVDNGVAGCGCSIEEVRNLAISSFEEVQGPAVGSFDLPLSGSNFYKGTVGEPN